MCCFDSFTRTRDRKSRPALRNFTFTPARVELELKLDGAHNIKSLEDRCESHMMITSSYSSHEMPITRCSQVYFPILFSFAGLKATEEKNILHRNNDDTFNMTIWSGAVQWDACEAIKIRNFNQWKEVPEGLSNLSQLKNLCLVPLSRPLTVQQHKLKMTFRHFWMKQRINSHRDYVTIANGINKIWKRFVRWMVSLPRTLYCSPHVLHITTTLCIHFLQLATDGTQKTRRSCVFTLCDGK